MNEITTHACDGSGEHKETGKFVLAKVLDVFEDKRYIKEGYVIMSIRPCTIKEVEWDYAPWYSEQSGENSVLSKELG